MSTHRLYLFDLDGTLFRGQTVIPGAPATLDRLRDDGAMVRFLTNNAGSSRPELTRKLQALGFTARAEEVYGTADAAGIYARQHDWQSAFVVGEVAMANALSRSGVRVVNADRTGVPQAVNGGEGEADGVIVGICRRFTYAWLDAALQALLKGAQFVATNRDATYPLEGGQFQPGAGSLVAAIETAAGRAPYVIGKPSADLVLLALADAGIDAQDAVIVGDRLDTDIAAGLAAGCATYLVLSGATTDLPAGQAGGSSVNDLS